MLDTVLARAVGGWSYKPGGVDLQPKLYQFFSSLVTRRLASDGDSMQGVIALPMDHPGHSVQGVIALPMHHPGHSAQGVIALPMHHPGHSAQGMIALLMHHPARNIVKFKFSVNVMLIVTIIGRLHNKVALYISRSKE